MPATLDPATALVLIDLQHGITDMPTAHPSEEIGVASLAQNRVIGVAAGAHALAERTASAVTTRWPEPQVPSRARQGEKGYFTLFAEAPFSPAPPGARASQPREARPGQPRLSQLRSSAQVEG